MRCWVRWLLSVCVVFFAFGTTTGSYRLLTGELFGVVCLIVCVLDRVGSCLSMMEHSPHHAV